MAELAQIGVTKDNLTCLENLKSLGYFEEIQDAARVAALISIKHKLYIGKDLSNVGSNLQTRWNTSLVDPDHFLRDVVNTLENKPNDLGVGLRSLIILGLDFIYSKFKNGGLLLADIL